MEMQGTAHRSIEERIRIKVADEICKEHAQGLILLRERDDFSKELDYFLGILSLALSPEEFSKRFSRPLVGLYCIQVPLELIDALGFHPFRLCSGSAAVQRLSACHIPVLGCPVIKSCLGNFLLEDSLEQRCVVTIVPTTCDWNAKLPDMASGRMRAQYIMELPRVKDGEKDRARWLEEVYGLKRRLEAKSGRRLSVRRLRASIDKYAAAWRAMGRLIDLRRRRAISGIWFLVIMQAFMLDNVESWTDRVETLLGNYHRPRTEVLADVFLAGSPILFPNFKLLELIEEAGMFIAADELCTSERNLTSVPVYDDLSEYGLLKALSERSMLSCHCPTFTDNRRREKNILDTMRTQGMSGVIFHVLKGCHPYDIESFAFEKSVRERGFHFLKIETDYSQEDRQAILTRLEAFRGTLD